MKSFLFGRDRRDGWKEEERGRTPFSPSSRLVAPSCWWFSWARAAARGSERRKKILLFSQQPSSLTRPALTAGSQAPLSKQSRKGEGVPVALRRSVGVSFFGSRESTTYKHPPSSGPASHFLPPSKGERENGGAYCRMKLLGRPFLLEG